MLQLLGILTVGIFHRKLQNTHTRARKGQPIAELQLRQSSTSEHNTPFQLGRHAVSVLTLPIGYAYAQAPLCTNQQLPCCECRPTRDVISVSGAINQGSNPPRGNINTLTLSSNLIHFHSIANTHGALSEIKRTQSLGAVYVCQADSTHNGCASVAS